MHDQIKSIFLKVVNQPAAERPAMLDRICAGDAQLRARVEALLAALDQAKPADFLATPHLLQLPTTAPATNLVGQRIGPYELREVIGEGGFGVVYLAERREPMVQRVALKIIRPGMDSEAVIARFEQERQALAVMDHPNVAKVLDGGVTPAGLPFFVMEHVNGTPITKFADDHRLTISQRLELFIYVCEAVQHAHMKGIIHRDIKPSNILVAPGDPGHAPIVKVIDFGVAKAISHTLTDKTIFTETGQLIGTPEYMSPEQAAGGRTDIDTRSDVYSLGVVLYELLCGTPPFDAKTLRAAGYAEIQRIIRDVDAPTPSTRLSSTDYKTGAAIAEARQADRERLAGELRRELEWIPMMALRKDRTRRYSSAESLAADVQRYLEGTPLEAGPESKLYRLRKSVRKHRIEISVAAAIAVALAIGVGSTAFALARALRAETGLKSQLTETQKARQAEAERAKEVVASSSFLASVLAWAPDATAGSSRPSNEVTLREALLRGAAMLDGSQTFSPRVAVVLNGALASGFASLADLRSEELRLRRAIELAEGLGDALVVADLKLRVARCLVAQDRNEEAVGLAEDVVAQSRTAADDRRLSLSLQALAEAMTQRGRTDPKRDDPATVFQLWAEAAWLNTRSLVKAQGLSSESATRLRRWTKPPSSITELADAIADLIEVHREYSPSDESPRVAWASRMMDLLLQGAKSDRAASVAVEYFRWGKLRAEALDQRALGIIYRTGTFARAQGRWDRAESAFGLYCDLKNRLGGERAAFSDPASAYYVEALLKQGRAAQAEVFAMDKLRWAIDTYGHAHRYTLASISQAVDCLSQQGRWSEAEPLAVELHETNFKTNSPFRALSAASLSHIYAGLGSCDRARPFADQSVERLLSDGSNVKEPLRVIELLATASRLCGTSFPTSAEALEKYRALLAKERTEALVSTIRVGWLLRAQGKIAEAEPYYRDAMEKSGRLLGSNHASTLLYTKDFGDLLVLQHQYQQAIDVLASSEAAARSTFTGDGVPGLAGFLSTLSRARIGLGYEPNRFAMAGAGLLEAYPVLAATWGEASDQTLECVRALVDLYTAWDKADPGKGYDAKAEEWKAKLDLAQKSQTAPNPPAGPKP